MTTWFITGSSRGLGRALAEAALAAGDSVAATARTPDRLAELQKRYGDAVALLPLDVTDGSSVERALADARSRFGRIDVVVNNAGYADVAPIETTTEAGFRAQVETDFWGVVRVSQAAIPILREQGGGLLMQISSVGGRVGGSPGIAPYQAAKFAVDGFSRVLAVETAPFGIEVMTVEPSGFATDWAGSSMTVHPVPEAYASTVGAMQDRMRRNEAGAAGDPVRAAEILVRVAHANVRPAHLLLGVNAVEMSIAHDTRRLEEAERWSAVSRSADFGQPYPAELPTA